MASCIEEESIPSEVEFWPCKICSRTFQPDSLAKHVKICEKTTSKRRKVFDSLRQRVEGTELARFHVPAFKKSPAVITKTSTSQVHKSDLPSAIKLPSPAESKPKRLPLAHTKQEDKPASRVRAPIMNVVEPCPYCDRKFGQRSYERHVLWCQEKQSCLPSIVSKPIQQEAKDRLEARLKYRAPSFIKRTVKEKYQLPKEHDTKPQFQRGGSIRRTSAPQPSSTIDTGCSSKTSRWDKPTKRRASSESSHTSNENNNISTTKTKTSSDVYNPFLTAERQLMELLECNDFKPYHKSTRTTTPTNANSSLPKPIPKQESKPIITSPLKSKKRQSVIDPPTDFKDTGRDLEDDIDFEMLENFINDNFGNDELMHKLDLDTISLDSCSTKNTENTTSYFDDVSIDPRLINDFDNLSIPDHLDTHATSTPDMMRPYPVASTRRFQSELLGPKNNRDTKEVTSPTPSTTTFKAKDTRSPRLGIKHQEIRTYSPLPEYLRVENINSPAKTDDVALKPQEIDEIFKCASLDLFTPDDEIYEEYKQLEESFNIEREEQHNRDVQNMTDNIGIGGVSADSAYGSLNRASKTKIRSKIMLLSPLAPAYQSEGSGFDEDEQPSGAESNGSVNSVKRGSAICTKSGEQMPMFAKFCHQCGKSFPKLTAKFCVWCGEERLVL